MSFSWCVQEARGLRMERYSWQVHFRNWYTYRRDWRSVPVSGTIRVERSRRFSLNARLTSRIQRRGKARLYGKSDVLGRTNSALATGGALRPALRGRAWARHRGYADSANKTSAGFDDTSRESKASRQRALRLHLISRRSSEQQRLPRQEGLQIQFEEARPAGD